MTDIYIPSLVNSHPVRDLEFRVKKTSLLDGRTKGVRARMGRESC